MNKQYYDALIDKLIAYSNAYYQHHQSLISDKEFDLLLKEAQAIELEHPDWMRSDSPTFKVGSDLTQTFKTVKHQRQMLSLENTYNYEEVQKWVVKMQQSGATSFVVEPKYDGNSFAARYVNGKLVQGLTRGDGVVGEDITQNCLLIPNLNNISKNFTGEIRGEIIMTNSEFERLNVNGQYANPRNLVSGTIKLLDQEEFKKRNLIAYVYWLEDDTIQTHEASLQRIQEAGFHVGPHVVCHSIDEVWKVISDIETMKKENTLDIDLDGAVLKVDDKTLWPTIGSTSKFPQWARAYKYEPENALTRILSIEFWVGLTGKITPVAIMEPVLISGSTVSKASLSNFEYIQEKDIRIGDQVKIRKAAEIIPQVMYPIKEVRTGHENIVIQPTLCPSCGSVLGKWNEDHTDIYCKNDQCPSQVVGIITKYCSVLEMDGFGEKIVQRLYEEKLLTSISDLYQLKHHYERLIQLDRLGQKIVDKLLDKVEQSKNKPLHKVLEALSIRDAGQVTARKIADHFKSIEAVMSATFEELQRIEDVGEVVANSVVEYFKTHRPFIKQLQAYGVSMKSEVKTSVNQGPLMGLKICITGSLSRARKEYEDLIVQAGGTPVDDVSKTTSILVTNDPNAGSSKLKNATKFGTKVISEAELVILLAQSS
jgi:DNA ligase (NAD+)